MLWQSALATVQYHGSCLTTQSCLDAIRRFLSTGTKVERALLLTHQNRHAWYLEVGEPEPVFVRGGFTSGYAGEGPTGLGLALLLFSRFHVSVEELLVSSEYLAKVDESRLTQGDIDFLLNAPVVRPIRICDYQKEGLQYRGAAGAMIRNQFQPIVPWFALDERLVGLALELDRDPGRAVFEAFRKLESQVKERCGLPISVSGVAVFRKAFRGAGAFLTWLDLPLSEVEGRAQLFEGAFMSYRNPRAHREDDWGHVRAYREFFVANELFLLEAEAVEVIR